MTVNGTTNVVEVNIDGELFKLKLSADQDAQKVLNTAVRVEKVISVLRKKLPNEEYHRLLLLVGLQLAAEIAEPVKRIREPLTLDKQFHTSKDETEEWIKTVEVKIESILGGILGNKGKVSLKELKKK